MSRTVAARLLIKPGTTVWAEPKARRSLLEPLPDDVTVAASFAAAGVAVAFVEDRAGAMAWLADHATELASPAILWIAYPKGGRADINRDSLWPLVAVHGLRPISQIAVDETWSALRFRPLAPGEPPFTGRG